MSMAQVNNLSYELGDIWLEYRDQVAKWGEQHHSDGTNPNLAVLRDAARRRCEERSKEGVGTWYDILREEYLEAVSETDSEKLYTELKQVAAVCLNWMMDIESRRCSGCGEHGGAHGPGICV